MEKRWAPLGRWAASRRSYRVGWRSTRNSPKTRNSSSQLLSTLRRRQFRAFTPPRRSTPIYRGRRKASSIRLSSPAWRPSPSQGSSRVYYAIHYHLRQSTFCLQGCLQTHCPIQGNILDRRSAGKCLLLLLNRLSAARMLAVTIRGTWSSCTPPPSRHLPNASSGCNTWCSSVPRDSRSMEISSLI